MYIVEDQNGGQYPNSTGKSLNFPASSNCQLLFISSLNFQRKKNGNLQNIIFSLSLDPSTTLT
jgi:hypothetical protein